MKWICIVAGVLWIAASVTPAIAECPVPPGAVKADLPSGLPPALSKAMGRTALPGEAFDTSDVYVKGHIYSRYIFVWNIGSRWIVATERGGIALRDLVSAYELGRDGRSAILVEEHFTSPTNFCPIATRLALR
ncbi:MAG TPA: hypothetical protein VGL82_12520 [Bryobacteraceae bacterium]|jgi:hypothetical protein